MRARVCVRVNGEATQELIHFLNCNKGRGEKIIKEIYGNEIRGRMIAGGVLRCEYEMAGQLWHFEFLLDQNNRDRLCKHLVAEVVLYVEIC